MTDSLFDLSGLNALVTGSSRGIGRAIADRFVQHGARVVISSLDGASNREHHPGFPLSI